MSNNTTDSSYLIHSTDLNIIICRCVFCFISWLSCLLLISIYFMLILKVKFNFFQKNTESEKDKANNILNDSSINYSRNDSEINNNNEIGLGSHFIFILTVSNFFGVFLNLFFIFIIEKLILIVLMNLPRMMNV